MLHFDEPPKIHRPQGHCPPFPPLGGPGYNDIRKKGYESIGYAFATWQVDSALFYN